MLNWRTCFVPRRLNFSTFEEVEAYDKVENAASKFSIVVDLD